LLVVRGHSLDMARAGCAVTPTPRAEASARAAPCPAAAEGEIHAPCVSAFSMVQKKQIAAKSYRQGCSRNSQADVAPRVFRSGTLLVHEPADANFVHRRPGRWPLSNPALGL
ncbi:MAG TPA: hypothetical protein VFW13_07775, partial [Phenylobacterium sp.]|nr:hypothetical protein [Phenylobacterium sp.]